MVCVQRPAHVGVGRVGRQLHHVVGHRRDHHRQPDRPGVGGHQLDRRRHRPGARARISDRRPATRSTCGSPSFRAVVDQHPPGRQPGGVERAERRTGLVRRLLRAVPRPSGRARRTPASHRPEEEPDRAVHLLRQRGQRATSGIAAGTFSTTGNGRSRPSQLTKVPSFSAGGTTGKTTSACSVTWELRTSKLTTNGAASSAARASAGSGRSSISTPATTSACSDPAAARISVRSRPTVDGRPSHPRGLHVDARVRVGHQPAAGQQTRQAACLERARSPARRGIQAEHRASRQRQSRRVTTRHARQPLADDDDRVAPSDAARPPRPHPRCRDRPVRRPRSRATPVRRHRRASRSRANRRPRP